MSSSQWFYLVNGKQFGPFSEAQLVELFHKPDGPGPEALVWNEAETGEWLKASKVEGLLPQGPTRPRLRLQDSPPPPPVTDPPRYSSGGFRFKRSSLWLWLGLGAAALLALAILIPMGIKLYQKLTNQEPVRQVLLPDNVRMELRMCPAGIFTMGSPDGETGREASEIRHQVTLSKPFWMGRGEVTQVQWEAVMGKNPATVKDGDLPVDQVAQVAQGLQEAVVVALMEADAGFIEDIEHADETGADLGGEADALGLAAGEGGAGAVEGEVGQADGLEKAEPGTDLLDQVAPDPGLFRRERQAVQEGEGLVDGQGAEVVDGQVREGHGQGLGFEAGAVAIRAGLGDHDGAQSFAHQLAIGFLKAALQERNDALEGAFDAVVPAHQGVLESDFLLAAAVQQDVAEFGGQITPGAGRIGAEVPGHTLQ